MHFDPYESKSSKNRRLISNIALFIIIILFLVSVLYLIFRDTNIYTNPLYFETIKVSSSELSNDNTVSFNELKNSFIDSDKRKMEDNFNELYPQAFKLIKMDEDLYDENHVYSEINNNEIVVSQCFLTQADWRDLEVIILSINNNKNVISIDNITMYKIKYNARTGDLVYTDYAPDTFKLALTTIGIEVDRKDIDGASYNLTYKGGLDDKTIDENNLYNVVYDKDKHSYHNPKYETNENSTTVTGDIKNSDIDEDLKTFCLEIKLERDYMHYFKNCQFEFNCNEIDEFNIVLNQN